MSTNYNNLCITDMHVDTEFQYILISYQMLKWQSLDISSIVY